MGMLSRVMKKGWKAVTKALKPKKATPPAPVQQQQPVPPPQKKIVVSVPQPTAKVTPKVTPK
jgi:hypothetical protein